MKSPWHDIDCAFDPMFTEAAEFVTSAGRHGTVPCCVFPIEDIDPFAETDTASAVKRVKRSVRLKRRKNTKPSVAASRSASPVARPAPRMPRFMWARKR